MAQPDKITTKSAFVAWLENEIDAIPFINHSPEKNPISPLYQYFSLYAESRPISPSTRESLISALRSQESVDAIFETIQQIMNESDPNHQHSLENKIKQQLDAVINRETAPLPTPPKK